MELSRYPKTRLFLLVRKYTYSDLTASAYSAHTAAVVIVAAALVVVVAVAAAEPENEKNNDDPAAVVAIAKNSTVHKDTLLKIMYSESRAAACCRGLRLFIVHSMPRHNFGYRN